MEPGLPNYRLLACFFKGNINFRGCTSPTYDFLTSRGGHVWKAFFRRPPLAKLPFEKAFVFGRRCEWTWPIRRQKVPSVFYRSTTASPPWLPMVGHDPIKLILESPFLLQYFGKQLQEYNCFKVFSDWWTASCCFWGASHHNRHLGSPWRITMDPHPTFVRTVGTGHKRRARGHRLECCNSRCNSRPWTQHMQSDKQPNKVDRWRHKVWFFSRGWHVHNPISLIREDWWNMCAIDSHCTFFCKIMVHLQLEPYRSKTHSWWPKLIWIMVPSPRILPWPLTPRTFSRRWWWR